VLGDALPGGDWIFGAIVTALVLLAIGGSRASNGDHVYSRLKAFWTACCRTKLACIIILCFPITWAKLTSKWAEYRRFLVGFARNHHVVSNRVYPVLHYPCGAVELWSAGLLLLRLTPNICPPCAGESGAEGCCSENTWSPCCSPVCSAPSRRCVP
jgi:hypothetical protein